MGCAGGRVCRTIASGSAHRIGRCIWRKLPSKAALREKGIRCRYPREFRSTAHVAFEIAGWIARALTVQSGIVRRRHPSGLQRVRSRTPAYALACDAGAGATIVRGAGSMRGAGGSAGRTRRIPRCEFPGRAARAAPGSALRGCVASAQRPPGGPPRAGALTALLGARGREWGATARAGGEVGRCAAPAGLAAPSDALPPREAGAGAAGPPAGSGAAGRSRRPGSPAPGRKDLIAYSESQREIHTESAALPRNTSAAEPRSTARPATLLARPRAPSRACCTASGQAIVSPGSARTGP